MLATLSLRTACLSWHVSTQLLLCRGGLHLLQFNTHVCHGQLKYHSQSFWVESPVLDFWHLRCQKTGDICCENHLTSCWLSACPCCAALSSNMLRMSNACQCILCVTACMLELQVSFQISIQIQEPSTQRQQVPTPQCITPSLCVSPKVCKAPCATVSTFHNTDQEEGFFLKGSGSIARQLAYFVCHTCLSLDEFAFTATHSRFSLFLCITCNSRAPADADQLVALVCASAEYQT